MRRTYLSFQNSLPPTSDTSPTLETSPRYPYPIATKRNSRQKIPQPQSYSTIGREGRDPDSPSSCTRVPQPWKKYDQWGDDLRQETILSLNSFFNYFVD